MLCQIKSRYEKFLDDSEGMDPDYPGLNFRGNKGTKISLGGINALKLKNSEDDPLRDFR